MYHSGMSVLAQLHIKVPLELKLLIQQCAADNRRSLNQEIVYRLRKSIEGYSR
jgi:hypothetical protein